MAKLREEARGLFAYSIHGRHNDGVVEDYSKFFENLSKVAGKDRQTSVGSEFVALTVMERLDDKGWALRFVTGRKGVPPLTYDPATGEEAYEDLHGKFVASACWAIVHPVTRFIVIERKRPGVSVGLMEQTLGNLGRTFADFKGLTIDFNPVTGDSFDAELSRFHRIRQASITVAIPNNSWRDVATKVTELAEASDASKGEVVMSAKRSESLSKDKGIVSDIRKISKSKVSPAKAFKVTGNREGEFNETTVSADSHQERTIATLMTGRSATVEKETIVRAAQSLLKKLESPKSNNG